MKQHPIPQNILDVEFKLFTRFTVREFAYMSIGIVFGGIFLYLFSNGTIPGYIGIPIFLISSFLGLSLALLPINEQNADVFLRNFIIAIRKPTLRVWRNENFDEKFEWLAEQRGMRLTSGDVGRDTNQLEQSNTRVIGGTAKSTPVEEYGQEENVTELDEEELTRLAQIEQIATEVSSTTSISSPAPQETAPQQTEQMATQTEPLPQQATVQSAPNEANPSAALPQQSNQAEMMPSQQTTPPPQTEVNTSQQYVVQSGTNQPIQSTQPNQPTQGQSYQDLHGIPQANQREEAAGPTQPESVAPTATQPAAAVKATQSDTNTKRSITISKDTSSKYATEVEDYSPQPGKIALYVSDKEADGISQALVLIKDNNGSIIQALQTDPQGLVLPKKELQAGEYSINIQHDKYQFPDVNFILEKEPLPVVNIRSIN